MDKFREKIGWYPVTSFGWAMTLFYTGLLIYVVIKINADLYSTEFELFAISILSILSIVVVLLIARLRGEKPFSKD